VTSRKTAMLNLVAAGFGIAVVPAAMASLATPGVHFVPLSDADALARAALLLPPRPSALAAAFADALQRRWSA